MFQEMLIYLRLSRFMRELGNARIPFVRRGKIRYYYYTR